MEEEGAKLVPGVAGSHTRRVVTVTHVVVLRQVLVAGALCWSRGSSTELFLYFLSRPTLQAQLLQGVSFCAVPFE